MCPHKNVTPRWNQRQDTSPRAEAHGQVHQEGNKPPFQQSIPIFDDSRVGHSTNADAGRTEQQSATSCPRRVAGVPVLAPYEGGDRRQLVEPDISTSEQASRAGLRRHIYGSLKGSENYWLEIHRLLCETSEIDDDLQWQITCKVMRTILQNKQPSMKHLSEMYLLQPK